MPQYGTIQRQYPRVEILRGFNPNEPQTFTQAYPVGSGVTILSGQVVTAVWNSGDSQYEWQLGWTSGLVPFIALNDSTDEDVIETGNLVALSCAGKFEIQTAFYTSGTFNNDAPVTPDGTTGSLKVGTIAGSGGAQPIVGFVTRNHGPLSVALTNSNVVNTNVISFQTALNMNNNGS